jgi:hypothetical protein
MDQNPKVFISYTHDSKEHIDKILEISDKLRLEGVDVILDQYEQSPSQGWPKWMDQNINNADFVLVVCTENYYKRVMDEEKEGIGLGIKWEGKSIYQHIYNSGSRSKKFIPVILKKEDTKFIPIPIQGHTHYLITEDADYEKLYWFLRDVNPVEKPKLGKLRSLPKKEKKSLFVGGFINIDLWNKAKWSGTGFGFEGQLKEHPIMCLLFEEKEPAIEIMKNWLIRLGETDKYNELRISIIEGDIPGEQPGYSIHIGSNILNIIKRADEEGIYIPKDVFFMINKLHRMNPEKDSRNLTVFKELYERFGSYALRIGILKNGEVEMLDKLYLHKRDIEFRNVKDIKSENDLDSVVLPKYRNKKVSKI